MTTSIPLLDRSWPRRHVRLESFLQRHLANEFAKVTWYEPCVMTLTGEKPVFSFAILTDSKLLVTENPPRQVQLSLSLGHISSLEVVNDFPDFLKGDEREQAQHIKITYNKQETQVAAKTLGIDKRPISITPSDNGGLIYDDERSVSRNSTVLSEVSGRGSQLSCNSNSSSLESVKSDESTKSKWRRLLTVLTFAKRKRHRQFPSLNTLNSVDEDSDTHIELRRSVSEIVETRSETPEVTENLSRIHHVKQRRRMLLKLFKQSKMKQRQQQIQFRISQEGGPVTDNKENPVDHAVPSEVPEIRRPLPPPPIPSSVSDTDDNNNGEGSSSVSQHQSESPPDPPESEASPPTDETSSKETISSDPSPPSSFEMFPPSQMSQSPAFDDVIAGLLQLPSRNLVSSRSQTALGNYADHSLLVRNSASSPSVMTNGDGMLSPMTSFSDVSSQKTPSPHRKRSELHLYVLNAGSKLFRHLNNAWNRFLIDSTISLDNKPEISPRNGFRERYEQTLEKFQYHLIFQNDEGLVELRRLVDGFAKEIPHSLVAKRLFWKDPSLFPALIGTIRTLMSAPENTENQTVGITMDKLKLCSSIICVLCGLLIETDVLPGRGHHLTTRNAANTRELLATLVTTPWVPLAYRDATFDIATSYQRLASQDWETLREAPLIRAVSELTNASTKGLYQFIQLVSEQSKELTTNQQTFGVTWLVRTLADNKHIESFISRLVTQILILAAPRTNAVLTPCQAVLLHQQLSVLQILLSFSNTLAVHVRLTYAEEFRYYVSSQVICEKVPREFPIRTSLLRIVESLRQLVLGKQRPIHISSSSHSTAFDTAIDYCR